MKHKDEPIMQHFLDVDFYKFTMGQDIFLHHPNVPVTFGVVNRTTEEKLARIIDIGRAREEIDAYFDLRPTNSDLHFLRGTNEYGDRMFVEPYLESLSKLEKPEYLLEKTKDGQLRLEIFGPWQSVTYSETPILSILNQLRNEALMADMSLFEIECIYASGLLKLQEKIAEIRRMRWDEKLPIRVSEFGTRRRDSFAWQDRVVGILATDLAEALVGTSNTYLAMKYDLIPSGTKAHEEDMVRATLAEPTREGLIAALKQGNDDWYDTYGWGLSIALPDTYGTDFYLREIAGEEFALNWKGARQDSADPIAFADKMIAFYRKYDVDPRERIIIPSDGLTVKAIKDVARYYQGKIGYSFGWGTDLTNDLFFKPISLVCKVIAANGRPAVKLSDNIAKAIGPKEEIELYKQWVGYADSFNKTCVY